MTQVKICGITQIEDTIWANELMPDYIGFVFTKSKRQISPESAKKLSENLNPKIKKVGVFVNASVDNINRVLSICPLDILQFHGDESNNFCNEFSLPVWKAFRVKGQETLSLVRGYEVDAILLDGYHPTSYGGEGAVFPWVWAKESNINNKSLIIAGGLSESNIEEVINLLHPMAVDISSAVETNGKKDRYKIERFIRKVRDVDETI